MLNSANGINYNSLQLNINVLWLYVTHFKASPSFDNSVLPPPCAMINRERGKSEKIVRVSYYLLEVWLVVEFVVGVVNHWS